MNNHMRSSVALVRVCYSLMLVTAIAVGWHLGKLGPANAELVTPATWLDGASVVDRTASATKLPSIDLPYLVNSPSREGEVARYTMTFPNEDHRRRVLLVIFTYTDCYKGLADVPFWSELQTEFSGHLDVIGVSAGDHREKLRHFLVSQGMKIPVVYDQGRTLFSLLEQLGVPLTPVLLLAEPDGTVLLKASSTSGDAAHRAEFRHRLRALLQLPSA